MASSSPALAHVRPKSLSRHDAEAIYKALVPAGAQLFGGVPTLQEFIDHVRVGDEFDGKVLVNLAKKFYRGGSFRSSELVSAKWWAYWKRVNPVVHLGEANGKHSNVKERLLTLLQSVITDPAEITVIDQHMGVRRAYLFWENFTDEEGNQYEYDEEVEEDDAKATSHAEEGSPRAAETEKEAAAAVVVEGAGTALTTEAEGSAKRARHDGPE